MLETLDCFVSVEVREVVDGEAALRGRMSP